MSITANCKAILPSVRQRIPEGKSRSHPVKMTSKHCNQCLLLISYHPEGRSRDIWLRQIPCAHHQEDLWFPIFCCAKDGLVGRGGLEPPTSRLSGVRSNHLSYRPKGFCEAKPVARQANLPKAKSAERACPMWLIVPCLLVEPRRIELLTS